METPITDHPVPSGVAKPDLTPSASASQSGPPQSAVKDDVESQTSSYSSARASGRNRKAPARYGSPVHHSVKEVEESASSSPLPGQVGGNTPVTPKRRFIRRNAEDFV